MHPMLNIAVRAARAGGRILIRHMDRLDTLTIEEKGKNDLVSEVDRKTEAEILSVLQRSYPDHAMLGEEGGSSGKDDAEYRWYIDPIDGTTNYLHGYPAFCVSIAVAHKGQMQQAVIYNPVSQEIFTASKGGGAYLDDKRLRITKRKSLDTALLGTGFIDNGQNDFRLYQRTVRAFTDATPGLRSQGSAALDLAYVAAGRLDGFWEFGLKPWDVAAGALIVREAGGLVGDMTGSGDWFDSGNIVAASPRIFDAMIRTFTAARVKSIAIPPPVQD